MNKAQLYIILKVAQCTHCGFCALHIPSTEIAEEFLLWGPQASNCSGVCRQREVAIVGTKLHGRDNLRDGHAVEEHGRLAQTVRHVFMKRIAFFVMTYKTY